MGSGTISHALGSVFSRAFSGSIAPAYFYLEFFPKHQDFVWGRTFPNPGGVMPFESYPLTIEVMNWKFPYHIAQGIVGSMPAVFWGESYANFGSISIPIIAFLMGCVVAFVSYLVSKLELNVVSLAFLVFLIQIFKDLSFTGFSGLFISIYIVSIILIVFLILFIRGKFKIRKNKVTAKPLG